MVPKVLFIDTTHPYLKEELTRLGFVCDILPGLSRRDYVSIVDQYVGIIIRSGMLIDQQLLERAVQLRFIGRVGAGMEGIDVEFATSRGILCLNAPEGNRDALAEHTVGMLLALFNKLIKADSEVRKGVWDREGNRGIELMGKSVGIVGYGNMGSAFARRLIGFGVHVVAYDKYKTGFGDGFVHEVTMEELMQVSDIVSLHVPLTKETHYLADTGWFGRFSKNFYLINTSRGQVVKTADLLEAIRSGHVLGAALDVLEFENYTFEQLKESIHSSVFQEVAASEKIILSPHIAGFSTESPYKMAKALLEKIKSQLGL